MKVFDFQCNFKVSKLNADPNLNEDRSAIVNWVVEKQPVAFLCIRQVENENLRKIEFGYYDQDKGDWTTVHSNEIPWEKANYSVKCECLITKEIRLTIFKENIKIDQFFIQDGNPQNPEIVYIGDILTNAAAFVEKVNFSTSL